MSRDAGSTEPWAALLREVSRSFYLTLRVLPPSVRRPIGLAYLLARATDTVADAASLPVAERRRVLVALRERILDSAMPTPGLGAFAAGVPEVTPGERRLMARLPEALEALDRSQLWEKSSIRTVLEIIAGGQILDLDRFGGVVPGRGVAALPDAGALDDYTYRVAGCVGEFWTRICRNRLFPGAVIDDDAFEADGVRLGKGLQLINILRDLPRDLEAGRCYLPADELARVGLDPDRLRDPAEEARLRPVYDAWMGRAEAHLVAGWEYVRRIPPGQVRVRLACAWPILIGLRTLRRLREPGVLDPARRVKVPRSEVRAILWSTIWRLPWPRLWDGLFEANRSGGLPVRRVDAERDRPDSVRT
jgi:farnesyl-diphosphate farnesyltransferase